MTNNSTSSNYKFITSKEVREMLGVSLRTLQYLKDEPGFPKSRAVTPATQRWLKQEIIDWMNERPEFDGSITNLKGN